MDLLPVSSSSVPAVTTDHQVPALSADTRPRTRAGKLVTLYLQPELFLCGVIILIFAPAIKQALTSSFRDFSFSWILFKWAQTLKRKVRRLWKGSYKSTIPITQLFPRCDMKKIFAGVRVGGVQAAPWQCAGAGPVLLGGEVSRLSSADSGRDPRHRAEIVVRLLDFHLQLHADNIKPVTLGGNTTAIWIFSMRANTMNRANNVPFLRLDEWRLVFWIVIE